VGGPRPSEAGASAHSNNGDQRTALVLPYDWAALGKHTMYGAPLNPEEWASVTMPTLVVTGAKSPAVLQQGSRALAEVLPNAELRKLEGVSHNLNMKVLAPVLAEFFTVTQGSATRKDTE
jgi:pimeloyl-ACP methyl ester carboxylesterase